MKKLLILASIVLLASCSDPQDDIRNIDEATFRNSVASLNICAGAAAMVFLSKDLNREYVQSAESYREDFYRHYSRSQYLLAARICDIDNDLNLKVSCRHTVYKAFRFELKSDNQRERVMNEKCSTLNDSEKAEAQSCLKAYQKYNEKYIQPLIEAHNDSYYTPFGDNQDDEATIKLARKYIARNCN